MPVLPENWHIRYLGGVDSASRLSFSKFRLQNPFLGKFRSKNSKLSVLPENWHSWYIRGADSESRLRTSKFRPQNPFLGKFGSKKSKLSVLLENWHTEYFEDADATLVFGTSNPKSIFGQVWDKKVKAVCFAWKFAHTVSRGCWFLF